MPTEIVTTDDLREFKLELLKEIKQLFAAHHGQPTKKWLKSYEVRKLLGISPGTLQNMRINGTLAFTKIGGVIFYDSEEIQNKTILCFIMHFKSAICRCQIILFSIKSLLNFNNVISLSKI